MAVMGEWSLLALSQSMSLSSYFISPVQLRKGVMEQPWWALIPSQDQSTSLANDMKPIITAELWGFGTLWWRACHVTCSREQACRSFQIDPLLFYGCKLLFSSCKKPSWPKPYLRKGIGIKIHSKIENYITFLNLLLQNGLDMTVRSVKYCTAGKQDIHM